METGLYYLNARMYDPVTARFLQADTYTGSQSDPLSLNLYTYCLNNPERYTDPSGHIAIELAVVVVSAVIAGMAVEAGVQKYLEKRVCIDYNRIVGEGLFSGAVSAFSFGAGNLLKCAVGPLAAKSTLAAGAGLTVKSLATTLIANAAGSAVSEAAEEMAHQFLVEGRRFSQIDYRQVGISAALGTVVSAGSTLAGAGLKRLKAGRAAKTAGEIVGMADDAVPAKMRLQYFAGEADEVVEKRVGEVVGGSYAKPTSNSEIIQYLLERPELTGTNRDKLLSSVQDSKLASLINELYRPGAYVGDGGTADILVNEFYQGTSKHLLKAKGRLIEVNRLIKSGKLGLNDLDIAEALRNDLEKSIKLFK